ncbi:MAG: DinB family protein, partial [Armatimonadetes bacterium]|nr:DinB family protein [Armatimonadota bacterium]
HQPRRWMGGHTMLEPLDHYRYLTEARHRLLDRVRTLSPEQYEREFPFGLKTVRRTLHHMAGAEWFVLGQLRGWPQGDNPVSLRRVLDASALDAAWRDLEPSTIELITGEPDWDRPLEITVIIPSRQAFQVRTTALRVFTQFCYHEVHHRSQVMAMLRQLGSPVETIDFLLLTAEAVREVSAEEALKGRGGG